MFKCCQHCTNDFKVCDGLTFISIKGIQSICIKLLITWTKKGEGMARVVQGTYGYWSAHTKVQDYSQIWFAS
jgi:hypothetical protein